MIIITNYYNININPKDVDNQRKFEDFKYFSEFFDFTYQWILFLNSCALFLESSFFH